MRLLVPGDDLGDHVSKIACGSTPLSLQVSISDAMTARCSPPPSEPANRAFFLFRDRADCVLQDIGINFDSNRCLCSRLGPGFAPLAINNSAETYRESE